MNNIQERVEEIIRPYYPDDLYLINDNHINEILKVINSGKPNVELVLPGTNDNIVITKNYDRLMIKNGLDNNESYNYVLDKDVKTTLGIIKYITDPKDDDKDTSNYTIRLNSKDIKLPLNVRTRQDGDRITIKNMNGSKKVNDVFIDNKLSKNDRDIYPIIVDSAGKIIFIPGIKKSNLDIPITNEYDIIIKYVREE